jgi:hypothetical protein
MKSLVVLSSIVLNLYSANCFAWEKVVDCDNGSLVLDQGGNDMMGRPTFQMVLRGQPLQYFASRNAIFPRDIRENGEFVSPVNTYDSAFFASRGLTPPPVQYLRQWIYVNRYNHSVRLTANHEGQIGQGGEELANWQFNNCWMK